MKMTSWTSSKMFVIASSYGSSETCALMPALFALAQHSALQEAGAALEG